jgi:tetratricopeptide (TPR) repeat protein
MKTMTISVVSVILFGSVLAAQQPPDIRSAGLDLLGALSGDMAKFERGMQALEALLAKNPDDSALKVLHGNGVFAQSGQAFEKGDIANATKLWQASLDEMAQAVEMAPNNIFVRARRGVLLISASRSSSMPPAMAKPFIELAVGDFEKVLEVREKEQTLSQRSTHQRGELLTGLADGWNRMGNPDKARSYFERITRDLKGTVYEQKANAWLQNKPDAKAATTSPAPAATWNKRVL